MIARRFAFALIVSLAGGCKTPPAPKDIERVALRTSEQHVFPEFTLTFIDVESDSRCPAQAMCVWAGNATIAVTAPSFTFPGAAAKQFLNTNIEPRSIDVVAVNVRLDSLTPWPQTSGSIPQDQYTAYFTVTRR